jgi:hypothetical protein
MFKMPARIALGTGSSGLIGFEVSMFFSRQGFDITAIDSNGHAFFRAEGGHSRGCPAKSRYRHELLMSESRESARRVLSGEIDPA